MALLRPGRRRPIGGEDAALTSPIQNLEFALPCTLRPGEYDYRVLGLIGWREVNEGAAETPGDPTGKIIVK